MRNRIIPLVLAAVLLTVLLAGCGGEKPEVRIQYPIAGQHMINVTADTRENGDFKWARYVVCEVTLEINDDKIIPLFDERITIIEEIIIDTISVKAAWEMDKGEQKDALREELRDKINEEFETEAVQRVIFSKFFFARG
jgi:flagellar basal body-associated protein FliL